MNSLETQTPFAIKEDWRGNYFISTSIPFNPEKIRGSQSSPRECKRRKKITQRVNENGDGKAFLITVPHGVTGTR